MATPITIHFWKDSTCHAFNIDISSKRTVADLIRIACEQHFQNTPPDALCCEAAINGVPLSPNSTVRELLKFHKRSRLTIDIKVVNTTLPSPSQSTTPTPGLTFDVIPDPTNGHVNTAARTPRQAHSDATYSAPRQLEDEPEYAECEDEEYADEEYEESLEGEEGYGEEFEEEEERESLSNVAPARPEPTQHGDTEDGVTRKSTVRYFERMNPGRIYPLLVAFTKDDVLPSQIHGVGQSPSTSIRFKPGDTLTIEPVLPGCTCHPATHTVTLTNAAKPVSARFFIVPLINGRIEGASVIIRRSDRITTRVDLHMNVVPRTWATFTAFLSASAPLVVAFLRQLQIDVGTDVQDSADLYLAATAAIVQYTPPTTLCAVLLTLSGVFFVRARARETSAFWGLHTSTADEALQRILQLRQKDSIAAATQLAIFLKNNRHHLPALLIYSHWHYDNEDFRHALHGFELAMRKGPLTRRDYLRAARSASRLQRWHRALEILQTAEATLPACELSEIVFYNAGCYAARTHNKDLSLHYIRKAINAGYHNIRHLETDPDLGLIRGDPEFQSLLRILR